MRLGFAVRVVSKPALRSHDGRRATPHLSVSLVYLRDILTHLQHAGLQFYRVAAQLLPISSAATTQAQMRECAVELDSIAAQVQAHNTRLTLHLGHHVALGSADDALAARNLEEIELQAALLAHFEAHRPPGAPLQSVLVTHVGGPAGDGASLQRFAARYAALSPEARRRLVVEHDTAGFSLGTLLRLHEACGVPVVFDYLHWQMHNPERLPLALALGLALSTWPVGVRPKVHLSTGRSEAHLLATEVGQAVRVLPPRLGQHADFIALADLVQLLLATRGLPSFDIMLEAKAGDLALLRLREALSQQYPDLAQRVG